MGLLINSLSVAALATLLATLLGLAAAITVASLAVFLRRIVLILAVIALALPPFVVANCWLHYLGNTGVWRGWLPLSIFGIQGVVFILALMFWPIPFFAALSTWRQLDAAHLQVEPAIRGWNFVRWLLWPSARNAVMYATALVFALALNQFAVPAILQVKVLPVEVWIRFSTALEPGQALLAGWPLIVTPLAVLVFLRRASFSWSQESAPPPEFRAQLGIGWFATLGVVTVCALLASVVLPIFQLLSAPRTWTELPMVWQASWSVALNSAVFAGAAASAALLLALISWRHWAVGALWILFLLPGMLLAIGVIWALNWPVLEVVYRSMAVIVLVLAMRYFAPIWSLVRQAFHNTDRTLLEAAKLEGLRGFALFRHVYWPRVAPVAAAAWYVAFLLCLWDVETITLLYPPGAETVALRVFNLLHYGHDAQVNSLCLILLAIAVIPAAIYSTWTALRKSQTL
jgi:iron(III) transport system permease protein